MNKLKIAIIGTGSVACNEYVPYLAGRKDIALSYFSRTLSKAEICSKKHGGSVRKSLAEIVADDPDAVLVLTNETQRIDVANELVPLRPRRIFFEKPLCARNGQGAVCENDFFEARDMLRRAHDAGIETAMMFNYRFFSITQRLIDTVASRKLGPLLQASFFVNYACWSHCIDLLRVFGGKTARVTALAGSTEYASAASSGLDIGAAYTLENGCTGTILGSSKPDFAAPLYMATLNFEGGLMRICDLDGAMDIYPNGAQYAESYSLMANNSRWSRYSASFGCALAAYLQSIAEKQAAPVPGMAGLEELQFEAALKRSAKEGRTVDVQREFPLNG